MEPLRLTRNLRLMVHSSVNYTKEEFDIIGHPLFRRLRKVKQLALLGDIFPSAMHTRFAHSVGVVSVVQQMLDALFRNSNATISKLRSIVEANNGQAIRIHEMEPELVRHLQHVARLGGLAHDIGHGPCSHAFESFSASTKNVKKILDDQRLEILKPLYDEIMKGHEGRLTHEAVSCIFFTVIWQDIGGSIKEPWMPLVIASILLGQDNVPGIPAELYEIIPLCRDMISSSPIDADRMEYLEHDSKMCGVTYGLYERSRILKSILAYRSEIGGRPVYRLGWRDSGLRAIEDFIFARFKMFIEVYRHKTNRAKEIMLEEIAECAAEEGISPVNTESLDGFMRSYCRLSDEKFLDWLAGEQVGLPTITDERILTIAKNLENRVLWRRIYEFKRQETENAEILLQKMQELYPNRTFIIDRKPIDGVKGIEKGAALLEPDEEGKYAVIEGDAWFEQSPIMESLRDKEKWIIRLYVVVDEKDTAKTKNHMRTQAFALAAKIRKVKQTKE